MSAPAVLDRTALVVAQQPRIALLKQLPLLIRQTLLEALPPAEKRALETDWKLWARPKQLAPPGRWEVWFCLGGRGVGKTRQGGEWCHMKAETMPGSRGALIGATASDVRDTMLEGESGIPATMKPHNPVKYYPSRRLVKWKNGAQAALFSGEEPQRLRGPQHHWGWVDEWAAFKYPRETWDQFM